MITKGFTPENGAKVFAIMESARNPEPRTPDFRTTARLRTKGTTSTTSWQHEPC